MKAHALLQDLLRRMNLSPSIYCFRRKRARGPDPLSSVRERIRQLFEENRCVYGYRRIWYSLRYEQISISEKVVRRLMAEMSLKVTPGKARKYSSYQCGLTPAPENRLQRNFRADGPNEKWLSDITELAAADGKVCLSPVIDCFDGLVVTRKTSRNPNAALTNGMLSDAVSTLMVRQKPILHTNRGVHYRWDSWIQIMKQAGLTRSMSRKACSPDNSACEGFFGRMKNEMDRDATGTGKARPD